MSDPSAPYQRLYINIDHVATIRQARRTDEPDPVAAATACEDAGADGITAHLREDRRHIQDDDVERLMSSTRTPFNLEIACTEEMLALVERLRPYQVTLVPEKRQEITTEGGLDLTHDPAALERAMARLRAAGVRSSLFIDPDVDAVARARDLGADAIELHTGSYAHHPDDTMQLTALAHAARFAKGLGLHVHAGHGLTVRNVGPVAAIPEIEELNIGHTIVSRAVFVGIAAAVVEMRAAMDHARSSLRT
ncbi:MAG: pyridoxine 5'-phosphate synthase [Gemmatimonadetes bacterium]|jgi:pyridoxine 5-phosphate synthase|nr:pyridoxine 5'-phosphate synthase [Gemmatimonadota bacterium]MCC6770023.1 pyridoxine 5'-phosphate synthase [Gemmatimonadaceae bacterium]